MSRGSALAARPGADFILEAPLMKLPYNSSGAPETRTFRLTTFRAARADCKDKPDLLVDVDMSEKAMDSSEEVVLMYETDATSGWLSRVKHAKRRILPLFAVSDVQLGYSANFMKHKRMGTALPPDNCCFSLHYAARTLDLVCDTASERDLWVSNIAPHIKRTAGAPTARTAMMMAATSSAAVPSRTGIVAPPAIPGVASGSRSAVTGAVIATPSSRSLLPSGTPLGGPTPLAATAADVSSSASSLASSRSSSVATVNPAAGYAGMDRAAGTAMYAAGPTASGGTGLVKLPSNDRYLSDEPPARSAWGAAGTNSTNASAMGVGMGTDSRTATVDSVTSITSHSSTAALPHTSSSSSSSARGSMRSASGAWGTTSGGEQQQQYGSGRGSVVDVSGGAWTAEEEGVHTLVRAAPLASPIPYASSSYRDAPLSTAPSSYHSRGTASSHAASARSVLAGASSSSASSSNEAFATTTAVTSYGGSGGGGGAARASSTASISSTGSASAVSIPPAPSPSTRDAFALIARAADEPTGSLARENADRRIVQLAIAGTLDFSVFNEQGDTLLLAACRYGLLGLIRHGLHVAKAAIIVTSSTGPKCGLHLAAGLGHPDAVDAIFHWAKECDGAGAFMAIQQDGNGDTACHIACRALQVECVQRLLDNSTAAIFVYNEQGRLPIHSLLERDDADTPSPFSPEPKYTAHMLGRSPGARHKSVASQRRYTIATLLLHNGSDDHVNDSDRRGMTPLHLAARCGDADVCESLLELGADPSIADGRGMRPMDYAKQGRHEEAAAVIAAFTKVRESTATGTGTSSTAVRAGATSVDALPTSTSSLSSTGTGNGFMSPAYKAPASAYTAGGSTGVIGAAGRARDSYFDPASSSSSATVTAASASASQLTTPRPAARGSRYGSSHASSSADTSPTDDAHGASAYGASASGGTAEVFFSPVDEDAALAAAAQRRTGGATTSHSSHAGRHARTSSDATDAATAYDAAPASGSGNSSASGSGSSGGDQSSSTQVVGDPAMQAAYHETIAGQHPPWKLVYDDTYGTWYFYNEESGESEWMPPPSIVAKIRAAAAPAGRPAPAGPPPQAARANSAAAAAGGGTGVLLPAFAAPGATASGMDGADDTSASTTGIASTGTGAGTGITSPVLGAPPAGPGSRSRRGSESTAAAAAAPSTAPAAASASGPGVIDARASRGTGTGKGSATAPALPAASSSAGTGSATAGRGLVEQAQSTDSTPSTAPNNGEACTAGAPAPSVPAVAPPKAASSKPVDPHAATKAKLAAEMAARIAAAAPTSKQTTGQVQQGQATEGTAATGGGDASSAGSAEKGTEEQAAAPAPAPAPRPAPVAPERAPTPRELASAQPKPAGEDEAQPVASAPAPQPAKEAPAAEDKTSSAPAPAPAPAPSASAHPLAAMLAARAAAQAPKPPTLPPPASEPKPKPEEPKPAAPSSNEPESKPKPPANPAAGALAAMLAARSAPKPDTAAPPAPAPQAAAPPTASPPADDPAREERLVKWFKMEKFGVPIPAIINKMKAEGVDAADVEWYCAKKGLDTGSAAPPKPPAPPAVKLPPLDDPEREARLKRWFMMKQMGVPEPAILLKMKGEGVESIDVQWFAAKIGYADPSAPAGGAGGTGARARPSTTKVHWNALQLDEERLKGSIWGRLADSGSAASMHLKDDDLAMITNFFTVKPTASSAALSKSAPAAATSTLSTALDSKRAFNLNIGVTALLRRFPSPAAVTKAVYELDENKLSLETLEKIKALLPTGEEVRAVLASSVPDGERMACDLFIKAMTTVPRFEAKLDTMMTKLGFEGSCADISKRLATLQRACNCVVESERLHAVLGCVLAVGNRLNEGHTGTRVSAISLDSLLKLPTTKAADKKTTLLDAVLMVLSRRADGAHVLGFTDDLEPIMDALRLDLKDILVDVERLKRTVQKAIEEYQTEEGALAASGITITSPLDARKAPPSEPAPHRPDDPTNIVRVATLGPSSTLSPAAKGRAGPPPGRPPTEREIFVRKMRAFAATAGELQSSLDGMAKDTIKSSDALVTSFCEDPKTVSANHVFGVLGDFIKAVKASAVYARARAASGGGTS